MSSVLPLELSGITCSFGRHNVLRQIDLTVRSGEVVGLMGANGSGKTTLFSIISGLLPANGGKLSYGTFGQVVADTSVRAKMSYVAHSTQLYGLLTARENVELFSELLDSVAGVDQPNINAEDVLRRVGLADVIDRPVSSFSRGMAQRVTLARALACRPDLLLLDEPLTALDRQGRDEIIELLRQERKRGAGILVSSHDLDGMLRVADRIVWLSNGVIAAQIPALDDLELFRAQVLAATSSASPSNPRAQVGPAPQMA